MNSRSLAVSALAAFALSLACSSLAAAQNHAPVAKSLEVTSLYRGAAEWKVTTHIILSAEDPDPNTNGASSWTFFILNPERFGTGADTRLNCTGATTPGIQIPTSATGGKLEVSCDYHPPVRTEGDELIQFEVRENGAGGLASAPGTVTVHIKRQGMRWEFQTAAGQALSSDDFANNPSAIPDVLGKTNQDFMFMLDWVYRNPQVKSTEPELGASADGHIVIRAGYITTSEAVTATTVGSTGGGTAPATTEDAVAQRRKATFGSELNYNFISNTSPNTGLFLETGVLGRINLDVDAESDETLTQTAEKILKLARKNDQAGTFRTEFGGRIVLKQPHRDTFQTFQTAPGNADVRLYPRNTDDLAIFEFGFLYDEALSGLADSTGIKPNRYFLRAKLMFPEIPGAPGHSKPLFGVELTGGKDQPRQAKLLYGADLAAIGNLFGVGN